MNTVNASTGYTGFQLHLGRSPQIILPIIPSTLPADLADAGQTPTSVINTLANDVANAHDNLLLSKISQTHYASTARNPDPLFNIGEMVMLSTTNRRHEYKKKGEKQYLIDEIIDSHKHSRGYQFLVRWVGYGHKHNLWIASSELNKCEALDQWYKSGGDGPDSW
jgi:hypothetical protein